MTYLLLNDFNSEELKNKCNNLPHTGNYDRLSPKDGYSFRYIDEGLWENRIKKINDTSPIAQAHLAQSSSSAALPSLDALCEMELSKRYPKGFSISGWTACLEKCINIFTNIISKKSFTSFTDAARAKEKRQIAYSATNRHDLVSSISIQDENLKNALQIHDDRILSTSHTFYKNSVLNGKSYLDEDGKKVDIFHAITCSSDIKAKATGNLRRISSHDNTSICYTGRINTKQKAIEQGSFIFFSELASSRKGIKEITLASGEKEYEISYAVNSVLSSHPLLSHRIPGVIPFAERRALIEEAEALHQLSSQGPIDLLDDLGNRFRVKMKPIFFSQGLNYLELSQNSLPDIVSGASVDLPIVAKGYDHILHLVEEKKHQLIHAIHSASENATNLRNQLQLLEKVWQGCKNDRDLLPEEKILQRDLLYKLLNIPCVYHCKHSNDRTGILIALSSAMHQWIELGLNIPEHPIHLTQDIRFKELFAAHLMTGHQITRYTRAYEGSVNQTKGCKHNIGYRFSKGLSQNPVILRLMPERYLTETSPRQRAIKKAIIISLHIFAIPLFILETIRHLGLWMTTGFKKEKRPTFHNIFPMNLHQSILHVNRWIPKRILNETSPQVKDRFLLAGSHQRCPEFQSVCHKKLMVKDLCCPFSKALTSEQYQKALDSERLSSKQDIGFSLLTGIGDGAPTHQNSSIPRILLDQIEKNRAQDPNCNIDGDLISLRNMVLQNFTVDLERMNCKDPSRLLIINGKRYGYDADAEMPKIQQAEIQANEIYSLLRNYFIQIDVTLTRKEMDLTLEKKILFAIQQLYQGSAADLLFHMQQKFVSEAFYLSGNDSFQIELNIDPDEILSDGSKGSLLLTVRLIKEVISMATNIRRSSLGLDENPKHKKRFTYNSYGIKEYKEKSLKGEGLVFAQYCEEIKPNQSLAIRMGVL
jgi:hypothetical protein